MSEPRLRERTIDIRITIDTDSVLMPRDNPGDAANPTSIAQDQGYMLVTASRGVVKNQGTGDVIFEARPSDALRFFISSGSNNFEHVVVLENVCHASGDDILKGFTSQLLEQTGISPDSHTNVLPARLVQQQFRFCQCIVGADGTGIYDLVFALYDRDEEAQPRLIGYYRWATQLTVTLEQEKKP